jgi:hypothetical protein
MKIINLRMHQIRALKELEIEDGVLNTEALMLILNKRQAKSKTGGRMLLKYLDAQDDEKIMARKMYTINMLNGSSSYSSIDELIIPEYVVVVDSQIVGFAMPLVENHLNLGSYINDEEISFSHKKEFLKKLGCIIDKVQRVDDESFKMQFGDLNEYNFIIDTSGNVKAIDLDSAYLGQDEPSNMAYYLLKNKYIKKVPDKYKTTKSGIVIPNDNSDLYCYNMIILDTLSNERMFKIDIGTYYMYLEYLQEIGVDKDLINCFKDIYIPKDNSNPKDLVESIPDEICTDADFKVFTKRKKLDI